MADGAMIGAAAGTARQNEIEARHDVLVYTTSALRQDVEVTGPISLVLYVSTTARSRDFTAKPVDVNADGSAYNVSEGILRRRYGELGGRVGATQTYEIHIDLKV